MIVSSSPHIRSNETIKSIMIKVIIALLPTTVFGIYFFGIRALLIILLSISSAVLAEYIWGKVIKKNTITDMSAFLTGLLVALNLSPATNFYVVIIANVFAIIVVKNFFGGLGQNIMNPALAARVFVSISYPSSNIWVNNEYVTTATPLSGKISYSMMDIFIGYIPGCIGEVSKVALILGLIFLIMTKVVNYRIPFYYILSFYILNLLAGNNANYEILIGGLFLGAFFMATDYSTSPLTNKGKVIFAVMCGIITFVIREFSSMAEGVSFAIIIMNLFVPLIDKYTNPAEFGRVKNEKWN